MFKFIDKLRKKPERKRQGIVIVVSLSITLVIAAFWLVSLVIKIQNGGFSFGVSDADKKRISQSIGTLKGSWDTFINDVNSISNKPETPAALSPTSTTSDIESNIE